MNKIYIMLYLIVIPTTISSQTMHLYGGKNNDVYLGCLNCNNYNADSIWNEYGTYGNSYNSNSIWNEYGTYGNEYNAYSPWNSYATDPPVVIDKSGNFYGYFTTNSYKAKRANFSLALTIYKYHKEISKNVGEWYDKIFD